jgi:hypothetical protein
LRKRFNRLGDKGQATLESAILLMVILAVWLGVTGILKQSQFFQAIFGSPWTRLSNTMEFGIPTTQKNKYSSLHPTSWARHSTTLNKGGG